jgi:hypothetical protein
MQHPAKQTVLTSTGRPHPSLRTSKHLPKAHNPTAEQIARARERRETIIKEIRKEKRVMFVTSCVAALAALIWIIAVSTDHWLERAFSRRHIIIDLIAFHY